MRRRTADLGKLQLEPEKLSLSEIFHENTKMGPSNVRKYGWHILNISKNLNLIEQMSLSYKSYPTAERVILPKKFNYSKSPIEKIIQNRRSFREYSGKSLSINELSKLLYYSYGVTGSVSIPIAPELSQLFRAAPSGGALYPLEIYPVIFNVAGLEKGIYHYNVRNHVLELIQKGDFHKEMGKMNTSEEIMEKANVLLLISAIFRRMTYKYNDRGYRFILAEAGHVGQNISLMSTAMNLGSVMIGGYLDDEINRFLKIDGVNEAIVYSAAVGKR